MAYVKHNFQPGHKLTASDLNEMDTQIETNEKTALDLQSMINNIANMVSSDILKLNIDADSEMLYLYNGNELLGEASFPVTYEVTECTGLSVTNTSPLRINVNEGTVQINAAITPNDCTQRILYSTSNPTKVTVSSLGVVTALASGIEKVFVRCGSQQQELNVVIGQKFHPTARNTSSLRWRYNESTVQLTAPPITESSASLLVIFPESGITVLPGYTLTVEPSLYMRINHMVLLTPQAGGFIVQDTSSNYTVKNATGVIMPKSVKSPENDNFTPQYAIGEAQTYINNTDSTCYLAVSFELFEDNGSGGKRGIKCTDDNMSTFLNALSIIVTPPEGE